ncbi:MAG: molybdopterin-dependent oxidoreductase FAD-binding subunit, partial [gamma proteobacterium symbiont of Clathrolucina costata]
TIGGCIGANRSDSALIPVLLALGAKLVNADAQVLPLETWLTESREVLITEILTPPLEGGCMAVKESRSFMALPVVCAAMRLTTQGGKISRAAVYAGCVAPRIVRLKTVEKAILDGSNVEAAVKASINPTDDILGSAEYKRYINAVKIADTVKLCTLEVLQ